MAPQENKFVLTPARFLIGLALLLLLMIWRQAPEQQGDFAEYASMTTAIAAHGTPAIRPADMAEAASLTPQAWFSALSRRFAQGVADGARNPVPAFYRGNDGQYYAIHFFTYSALAAVPFKLFKAIGISPFKCFQLVNVAFVFLLGVACLRLFDSATRAALAVALFLLSGGLLYFNWSSPEVMSAAGLLCALIFFITEAPLIAGAIAGIAAMQNPPIVLFIVFAPLLKCVLEVSRGKTWRASASVLLQARYLLALALAGGLFVLPLLFNLWQFNVPSQIAAVSADVRLISMRRLVSLYVDLNQGMLIGVPALFLFLLAGLFWRPQRGDRALLLVAAALSVAMAVPALSTQNWNSGAIGMMRYAFWAAMPLLFALLLRLSRARTWPRSLIAGLLAVQCLSTWQAQRYDHLQFSPAARFVLRYAPALYDPEPEIFVERLNHEEIAIDPGQPFTYGTPAQPRKTLYKLDNNRALERLCGPAGTISAASRIVEVDRGWAYINGRFACDRMLPGPLSIAVEQFADSGVQLLSGWSQPEFGGGNWTGVWSDGAESTLKVRLDPALVYRHLTIAGHYWADAGRTRVVIDGEDAGWLARDGNLPIALKRRHASELNVSLRHEPGALSAPTSTDRRRLAFFLRKIVLD